MLLLNVEYCDSVFTIVNVYAPNDEKSRCCFYKKLKSWINRHSSNVNDIMLLGDFNCCLRDADRSSRTHIKDKSRIELEKLLKSYKLTDTWGHLHPDKAGFTWRNSDGSVCSRLDYVFINENQINSLKGINTTYVPHTDHRMVHATINVRSKNNGPGYWKLNATLLENSMYIDGVNKIIDNVSKNSNSVTSKRIIWEIFKVRVKEFSIQFSINLAKRKQNILKGLQEELSELCEVTNSNLSEPQLIRKNKIVNDIDCIVKKNEKGVFIRSKAKWAELGERSNKYFLALEKLRQSKSVITEIKDEHGLLHTEDESVLDNICKFYDKLYKTKNPNKVKIKQYIDNVNLPSILSDQDKAKCDRPLDITEFDYVINKIKIDKSPGDDGLTANFYKKFWPNIRLLYFDTVVECFEQGELSPSMKRAIVALLFKKGDKWLLKNYRPISLSNYDYKVLAFVLAERLQSVIGKIIGEDQTAYIKKRFIGNSARTIQDVIDYCEKFNKGGLLLCLDFEKAFDSLEWDFLFQTLRTFNFGFNFVRWVEILYTNPALMFKNNGWISKKIFPSRGVRQGCPISALLFIMVVEVLAVKLRNNNNIHGLQVGNMCIKLQQYADDTTLILQDLTDVSEAIACIDEFGDLAGLRLNKTKTEGILLGPLKNQFTNFNGINFTNGAIRCLGIYVGHDKNGCLEKKLDRKIAIFRTNTRKMET